MAEENSSTDQDPSVKCSKWLDKCSLDTSECDTESCCSEFSSSTDFSVSSGLTSNSAMDSGFSFITSGATMGNIVIEKTGSVPNNYHLATLIDQKKPQQNGKIQIYKSKKVHIGDVNYIQGSVYVNGSSLFTPAQINDKKSWSTTPDTPVSTPFHIIERRNWLAQPPLEVQYMKSPAKHIIISHSATESASTLAENTLLVRLIQSFHVDSRKWSDIAYNFLIGADGSVYEGRGWNVIGSHTLLYNSTSVGICFIGTFVREKPTENALKKALQLIDHGVSIGTIDKDYSLLGHCQCSGTASPGEALFEEIRTWKNFDSSISLRNPSMALPSLKNSDKILVP